MVQENQASFSRDSYFSFRSMISKSSQRNEQKVMLIGVLGQAIMVGLGVWVSVISNSHALLVDATYAGVMMCSLVIGLWITRNVTRPRDRSYPYGYSGQEAVYVMFRCLILLGVLSSGIYSAINTIWSFIDGDIPDKLILGPVLFYSLTCAAICAFLWCIYRLAWVNNGRQSMILRNEMSNAIADGSYTVTVGIALQISPLLLLTPLSGLSPIFDSILVIITCFVMGNEPLKTFLTALWQISGGASELSSNPSLRNPIASACLSYDLPLEDLLITELGRSTCIVAYCCPEDAVLGSQVDKVRDEIQVIARTVLNRDSIYSEVVISSEPVFT
jgi:predicted Co/Zn/Cd cation transporter (cation efflux family)